jgi:hypothetical protein
MVFRFHALMADEGGVVGPDSCHFPTPWTVEEQFACFTVRDASGKALGYFYYKEEPDQRSAKSLTKDQARTIAARFAKLPEDRDPKSNGHALDILAA